MEEQAQHEYWKDWFSRNGSRLLLYARQLTHSAADAEDVLQEAFVRFWKHQRHLPGEPAALVFASIRRVAVDRARHERRRERREAEALTPQDDVWFQCPYEVPEQAASVQVALGLLPLEQREVLVLKVWGELTFEQIGAQMGISPNTAASRYRQAMTALRRNLLASIP